MSIENGEGDISPKITAVAQESTVASQMDQARVLLQDQPERVARLEEAVRRFGWSENDARITAYALADDMDAILNETGERLESAVQRAAEALLGLEARIDKAADRALERVDNESATMAQQQLKSFESAFAKVAADTMTATIAKVATAVTSPLTRWLTATIVVMAMVIALAIGYFAGRQQVDSALVLRGEKSASADVRRFVSDFISR